MNGRERQARAFFVLARAGTPAPTFNLEEGSSAGESWRLFIYGERFHQVTAERFRQEARAGAAQSRHQEAGGTGGAGLRLQGSESGFWSGPALWRQRSL